MKTLEIEGFQVTTNLDEQQTFIDMCNNDGIDLDTDRCLYDIECELRSCNLIDFIEEVGINETPVSNYFYKYSRGYKERHLEPFNWRATKKKLTIIYTGAMGDGEWYAEIKL